MWGSGGSRPHDGGSRQGAGAHQPRPGHSRLRGHCRGPPAWVGTGGTSLLQALLPKHVLPGRTMEVLADIGGGQASPRTVPWPSHPIHLHKASPCTTVPPAATGRDPRAGHPLPGRQWPPVHSSFRWGYNRGARALSSEDATACGPSVATAKLRRSRAGWGHPGPPPQRPGEGTRLIWTMMVSDGCTRPRALPA